MQRTTIGLFNIKLVNTALKHYPIELVIFDCDGVLIDSELLSKHQLLLMLNGLGVSVSGEYFDTHFLGHSFEHVADKILEDYAVTLPGDFQFKYQQALMTLFAEKLTPTAQVEWMLAKINIIFCVATSSSPQRVTQALSLTGLERYFGDCVFTASEVKRGKPAPDLFLHAASKMGFSPRNCLVIEDSPAGIQGAQAADMQVIRYAGASHLNSIADARFEQSKNIKTIFDWKQLFELVPSLSS